jgi:uncharacterized membrane protein HdeD (DUF308 family)
MTPRSSHGTCVDRPRCGSRWHNALRRRANSSHKNVHLILVGIAQFVFALHTQTAESVFPKILIGIISAIAGLALAFLPIEGVIVLTGVLGTLLLIQAGLLTVTAFQLKPLDGWGWYLADAIASLLLGILIFVKWPNSSMWAIGTLVGVAVLVGGISRIMIAAKIRSSAGQVERYMGRPA